MSHEFQTSDTTVHFRADSKMKTASFKAQPYFPFWNRCINYLESIGFHINRPDPDIRYRCLQKDHVSGQKGNLKFKTERYPAGFKFMFFQDIYVVNPHGGQYDFDKYEKMPYLLQKQYLLVEQKLISFMKLDPFVAGVGMIDTSVPRIQTAEDRIRRNYVEVWYHPQTSLNFDLTDLDGTQGNQYAFNTTDRDGTQLLNGQVKYFRNHDGYLHRGKIYYNVNNMWWVIEDTHVLRNIAAFQLFDLNDSEPRGRVAEVRFPLEYKEKKKALDRCSTKELLRELRSRGRKVS